MIAFANAKINIGLSVTEKRPDGFHNLISCFYPVDWTDIVEVIEKPHTTFTSSGLSIPGDTNDNLCLKAWRLLNQQFKIPPVGIHLHKTIPIGAGLGGGSSDGSYTIMLLNKKFNLGLRNEDMENIARELGSDCAFFIKNQPVLAIEKGDVFENINLSLKGKWVVLVFPEIHITTKEAYSGIKPENPKENLLHILARPLHEWKLLVKNDFEKHLFPKYPVLEKIKADLYQYGAVYSSMTGSGSCIYGIFDHEPDLQKLNSLSMVVKKLPLN